MSKKKAKQSESHLPDGGYVPTSGFNYGLDGFDFDMDYGDGVEDGAVLPEAYGMADLPEGILPESPEDSDEKESENAFAVKTRSGPLHKHMGDPWGLLASGAVLSEEENSQLGKESSLANLDWLDPSLEQDEDRLPVNPVDKAQATLQEAWVDTRTNGLELIPNRNKEVERYQAEVRDPGQTSGLPGYDNVKAAMQKAMRRSACGSSMEALLKEAAEDIGSPDITARLLAGLITEEHGLAGNVFIRAAAFPGMHNGKWDALIKKKCASAAYILVEPNTKMAAFENYLGKRVVLDIPWKEALRVYTPRLKALGIKVAGSDPRTTLKVAFTTKPTRKPQRREAFTTHKTPVEMVSMAEAKEKFSASKKAAQVEIKGDTLDSVLKTRAQKHVLELVRNGSLTKKVAKEIISSGATPKEMLRYATSVAFPTSDKDYKPSGIHTKDMGQARKLKHDWAKKVTADLKKSKLVQAKEHVQSLVDKAQITQRQANKLLKSKRNAGELVNAASAVMALNNSKRGEITATPVREYSEAIYTEAIPESRVTKTSSVDVRKLIRWSRIQMSEGVLGKDFDDLIAARFSKRLIKASEQELVQVRDTHEGLSGQIYVDTEAYASPEGTKGCDRGADRHRTNGLKFALDMPRCGTCKFANKLPDGVSVCQKYNKILVDEAPVEDPKTYQIEALRLAGASDAEITASLFSGYNPSEFHLSNDSMMGFDFNDTPEYEALSGVFFGGMSLGEEDE